MFIPQGTSAHALPPYALLQIRTPSSLLLLYRDPFTFPCNIQIKQHVHVWAGGWYISVGGSGGRRQVLYGKSIWMQQEFEFGERLVHMTVTGWRECIDFDCNTSSEYLLLIG